MTSIRMRKHARLFLATGVVPAVGLLGTLAAPNARGDAVDDAFIGALKAKNITFESPATAINSGHLVCHELDLGSTPEQTAQDVMNSSQLDGYHAGYFVGVSIRAYCPKYAGQ
ncbi:DUF732 domain-containing protein [Mycobacterium parmense]|nr:DUF732 domain-containing protein [Mycobacterium parmense]MCV7350955.1 DUF732 domain-containing protein [Mycobacterium parmense]ORW53570.1 hypothetical protein AWC20_19935 [Mycobacterium parmense]